MVRMVVTWSGLKPELFNARRRPSRLTANAQRLAYERMHANFDFRGLRVETGARGR